MLGSITPLGERSRGMRWTVTATAFAIGAAAGGVVLGALSAAVGLIAFGGLSSGWALAALAGAVGAGLAVDLGLGGMGVPGPRRQVDERWLRRYRGWVYGLGFGFQLGAGVLTIVATSTVYVTLAAAALSGSIAAGSIVGAVFGIARAVTLIPAGRIRTPAAVVAVDGALRRHEAAAGRLALAATGSVLVAALLLAAS
jgi:hypothetical protein